MPSQFTGKLGSSLSMLGAIELGVGVGTGKGKGVGGREINAILTMMMDEEYKKKMLELSKERQSNELTALLYAKAERDFEIAMQNRHSAYTILLVDGI